jgi:uncharacterized protein
VGFKQNYEPQAGPHWSRRKFLRAMAGTMLGAAAMGAGGWTYATRIEPGWVDVVELNLQLPRLDAAFDGFRLAQISDIHLSEAMTGEQVAQVSRLILDWKPDIVAITGDFVDKRGVKDRFLPELAGALRPLASSVQVLAVLGNHDYTVGSSRIRPILEESGIIELRNKVFSLERDVAQLHFAGIDDVWRGRPRMDQVLQNLPNNGAAVLLVHAPDYADKSAATGRFDLQISGHSHGGQVVLPFIGPPVLPYLGEKYPLGLYRVGSMLQYTNRGLGTSGPQIRFNCRPEVTLFTFVPGSDNVKIAQENK